MNEVNQIHLGRQAFTISVEAHKSLRLYLDAIEKQVGDKEVMDEVELRMAELLSEHGVTGDKVILPADVDFLKEQLGNPKDFKEDAETTAASNKTPETKRLFRDTDNAMLAGVAAGISAYLGIDVVLVRILFVISIVTGGWGLVVYGVLWLLVPEAKTSSDRLQMAGKPVTVDGLKEIVERADVKGAAQRANNTLAGPINSFFRTILKVAGLVFIVFGLSIILGLVAIETYVVAHNGSLLQDNIFPVGFREHLLFDISLTVMGLISLFIVLFGMAIFRRKWPIRPWITGMLIGLILIGTAAGGALAADAYPNVRDRYNANVHNVVRSVPAFNGVNTVGDNVTLRIRSGSQYSVSFKYYGAADISKIKTSVSDGTLLIDSQAFDGHRICQTICIPDTYNVVATVTSPNVPQVKFPDGPVQVFPDSQHFYSQ